MKNASQKKWYFSILNGDFSIHFFFRSVLNFLLKKNATEIFLHLKLRNLHTEWRFLHVFQKRFWFFFEKKTSTGNFLRSEWRNIRSEWRFLHSFFSEAFWFFIEKQTPQISPFKIGQFSPFWIEISPFMFFFQKWFELKKKPTDNVLHSIFFRSVLNFFFEKQIPQIIFSIQNGEISILNGDFSIQFFFRRVLNFKKKYLQIIFSIQNGEWRFLHSNAFQKRFWFFFENNLYREFSPFRMEKSPFWMKTSPFIFSEAFWFFIEKQTPQIIFSIQNWKNLHSEWRFLHSIFFRSVFIKKKQTPLRLHSTNNFLHLEWRNLHSEWRFLHSNFFRSVSNLFFEIYLSFFPEHFLIFSPFNLFQKRFEPFFEICFSFFSEHFLHSEWRNLHLEWRFLHSNFFRSVSNIFLTFVPLFFPERFLHLEWRNLHSEWRFLHLNFFRSVSNLFFEMCLSFFSRAFSPFRMEKSRFRMEKDFSIQTFSEAFRTFFWNLSLFFSRAFSSFRMEKSPFRMEISPFKLFQKRFEPFFFKKSIY